MVSNTHLHEIVKPMYNLAFIISDGRAYLGIYKNYFNLLFFSKTSSWSIYLRSLELGFVYTFIILCTVVFPEAKEPVLVSLIETFIPLFCWTPVLEKMNSAIGFFSFLKE